MGGQLSTGGGGGSGGGPTVTKLFSSSQPEAVFDRLIERMDEIADGCAGEMLQLNGCMNRTGDPKACPAQLEGYRQCQLRRDATMKLLGRVCGTEQGLYEACMQKHGTQPTACVQVLETFLTCSERAVADRAAAAAAAAATS